MPAGKATDVRGDRGQDGQQAGDGGPVRALQRKLYRAAKQSSSHRFQALFDRSTARKCSGGGVWTPHWGDRTSRLARSDPWDR